MERKRSPYACPRRRGLVRLLLRFLTVVLVAGIIAACGGGDGDGQDQGAGQGAEGATAGQPRLACSQECRARGQCGDSSDRGTVILVNLEQPAVAAIDHDLAVPAGTVVTIAETRPQAIIEMATGVEFNVNFYRVFIPERNLEGWVAGWCVAEIQQ